MLFVLKVIPVFLSTTLISAVLEITISISSPLASLLFTVRKSSIETLPPKLAINLLSSEIFPETPPTWKVLNVNCVPTSPNRLC